MQYSYNRQEHPDGDPSTRNEGEGLGQETPPSPDPAGPAASVPGTEPLRMLDRRVVVQWRVAGLIRAVVTAVLVGAVVGLVFEQGMQGLWAALGVLTVTALWALFWPPLRYRRWGYRVRDADVFVRYGVVWRVTSVIPHRRLQHVDTERGPLERWLGLARVVIYTAGNRGAQTTVPGLDRAEAEALRDRLGRLGQGDDAV